MKSPFHKRFHTMLALTFLVSFSAVTTQAAVVNEIAKLLASDGAAAD